jgi:hypothetical protein
MLDIEAILRVPTNFHELLDGLGKSRLDRLTDQVGAVYIHFPESIL